MKTTNRLSAANTQTVLTRKPTLEANVATPTLAKSPNSHQLFAAIARPVAPRHRKPRPTFRVFPTGTAEYLWRIAELTTEQTVSCHKSLSLALKKCTRLNHSCGKGVRHESK